jgi:hypothetical protein
MARAKKKYVKRGEDYQQRAESITKFADSLKHIRSGEKKNTVLESSQNVFVKSRHKKKGRA